MKIMEEARDLTIGGITGGCFPCGGFTIGGDVSALTLKGGDFSGYRSGDIGI